MSFSTHAQQAGLQVAVTDLLLRRPASAILVYAESLERRSLDSAVSNAQGKAIFGNLAPGRYRVFSKAGRLYAESEATDVLLRAGQFNSVTLALPLQRESTLDEVVVNDRRLARLNTQNAEVSSIVSRRELQSLPIEGRDITRSLFRLPNLTLATQGYAEAPNVAINGLNGIYTNYLIDGMDNNERFLGNMKFNVPVGFAEGITVYTNNYSVEFGNTSNGLVNVTTRSGTNEFTGEVFYLTRPGRIVDSPSRYATADLSGNAVKDGFRRHQVGVGLGGPIRRDKTFFYVNVEQTFDRKDNRLVVPALDINEIVTGNNYFSYVSGKIDQLWSGRFKSSLRVNVGHFDIDRQGGGLEGGILFPSAASTQRNRTYLIAMKNAYLIGGQVTGETNYQRSRFRWNYRDPVNPTNPSVTVRNPSGVPIATIGQSGAIFDDIEDTDQFQQKFSLRTNNHTLKAGIEFTSSTFSLLGGANPYGTYDVQLTQAQLDALKSRNIGSALDVNDIPRDVQIRTYDVELRPTTFGARQNVLNLYIEDLWSVTNRLNLTFGLRYDYDNLSKGGGTKGDLNNLAPRIAFNLQLSDRSVIRGGYGIFYDKIKYSVYSDNLQFSSTGADFKKQLAELQRLGVLVPGADLNRITFPGNLNARSSTPVTYLNGPSSQSLQGRRDLQFSNNIRIMNPNGFQNPYSHQVSLGYQYKPSANTLFSVDLVHSATNNLFYIYNLNAPSPYPFANDIDVKVRTVAQADLTRPIPIRQDRRGAYAVVNGSDTLRGIARNVFMTKTDGIARYYAANFVLQKLKGNDRYAYRLVYSLSSIKSNTTGINTRAQDSNNYQAEFVYDDNDRRHVISGVFFYHPFRNLVIAPTVLLQSGQPVTRIADAKVFGTTDLNGDSESFSLPADIYPGETRNSDRLPWAKTIDVSVKFTPRIFDKSRLELSADVFNVLNTQNITGFPVVRSASNQFQVGPRGSGITVRAAAPPRQFQFGARYFF
ncbi:TonB-dependent receptor [Nibrella viscosa]|uniref:TonB-dependent receptor n=1 Tax=Nibrella viscosa TaxID=1084524 RepID=A0ABP8L3F7_9BACT